MLTKEHIQYIKNKYPKGTRIKIITMVDNNPIPENTCGTVQYVDSEGKIMVEWDNGISLALIDYLDVFEILEGNKIER